MYKILSNSSLLLIISLTIVNCQQPDFGGNCGEINGYKFEDLDSNKDEKIQQDEFKIKNMTTQSFTTQACFPRTGTFEQVDSNNDKEITKEEFNLYQS